MQPLTQLREKKNATKKQDTPNTTSHEKKPRYPIIRTAKEKIENARNTNNQIIYIIHLFPLFT